MILTYDSILGIPTVQNSGATYNTNNNNNNDYLNGINLGIPSILLFAVVLVLFIVLFSSLGKKGNDSGVSEGTNGSSKALTIILGGVLVVVVLLNGLQYFFNINLTARLDDLFSDSPSIDLTVEQPAPPMEEVAPVPEIKLKPQVFHVPGNKYTFDNADAICQAYGSKLANYDQIENAYKNGAEWCSYGWSEGQMAYFPTQKKTFDYLQGVEGHENDCGRPGINGGYIANPNVRFGINCYGYKPKITEQEQEVMNNTPLYPRTLADKEQEKRVDFWRGKIPEILVAPFNKNVWSLI
jgi:hypothetical protein|uniref:Link domain-containing protein n=1 Tax=viral metagenome TaxID=1070528 RepID=A0A6C0CKQ4_9ZZZZ